MMSDCRDAADPPDPADPDYSMGGLTVVSRELQDIVKNCPAGTARTLLAECLVAVWVSSRFGHDCVDFVAMGPCHLPSALRATR